MTKEERTLLHQFQCEYNRSVEEEFARMLGERNDLRLFFVNENQAFTDGRNIVVDPAWNELFTDLIALEAAEDFLKLDHVISKDPWLALKMSARAQNIHETLHILYSNFPGGCAGDERASTKARRTVLSLIANIIEDAFIEAAGCSIYDNMECFLLWRRVALYHSSHPSPGTVERSFAQVPVQMPLFQTKPPAIVRYLNYMAAFLLYPMVRQEAPDEEIAPFVESTRALYSDGAMCGDADLRYAYVQRVFDLVEPLIIPGDETLLQFEQLERLLAGRKTHSAQASSIIEWQSKGRYARITRSLFKDESSEAVSFDGLGELVSAEVRKFITQKDTSLRILAYQGLHEEFTGQDFDCAELHQGITIKVDKPRINLNLKKAYQNVYSEYRLSISSYSSRFSQLLRGRVDSREDRQLFGTAIQSRHLGDVKKRYWYRNGKDMGVPDISLMLLIDGSGSMSGKMQEGAIASSVVLHEVLRKNGIRHAIVEHRAIYGKPELQHNILVDFDARPEEKYNLLALDACHGTREGLSLFWAEKYLLKHSSSKNRLIIMISDGEPAHDSGDGSACYPPVSTRDAFLAAQKITRRGTGIIAIALDEQGDELNYNALKAIYPSVVSCTDINRLTGQLLGLISKWLV